MIYPQDAYLPHEAEIVEFIQDADDIFTLRLRFVDEELRKIISFTLASLICCICMVLVK